MIVENVLIERGRNGIYQPPLIIDFGDTTAMQRAMLVIRCEDVADLVAFGTGNGSCRNSRNILYRNRCRNYGRNRNSGLAPWRVIEHATIRVNFCDLTLLSGCAIDDDI